MGRRETADRACRSAPGGRRRVGACSLRELPRVVSRIFASLVWGIVFATILATIAIGLSAAVAPAQQMLQTQPQQAPKIVPAPASTPAPPQEMPMQSQPPPPAPAPPAPPEEMPMQSQPPPPPAPAPPAPELAVPMQLPPPVLPSVFRGCWDGTVDELDWIKRMPGAPKVGYWTPKTYRLCYRKVGDGPFNLTFGETGVVPTEKIAFSKGRVDIVATDGRSWAKLRAFLHLDEYNRGFNRGATFAVDEDSTLECSIDQDRMQVRAEVDGRREDDPWFHAHWHTTFVRVAQ